MSKKAENTKKDIKEKLEYIGLDLEKVPKQFKKFEALEFRIPKFYDEKQYRQYRYISIKDIQILLSPTNRLDELEVKYSKARPLSEYLDNRTEGNILKHTKFLNMLRDVKIEDIEKIEEEQEKLNKKIPFKVKFNGNYLWQIYYSENTDQYFMLVPTEDADYSTFFYLLKKQLENKKSEKIFVPIRNINYSNTYLNKNEFEDIENYLWLFTKDWAFIYEVYNKKDELSIRIIGETEVYDKIRSPYKIRLNDELEARQFYKLVKAMFILQTELPHYFQFKTNINKKGSIDFYIDETIMDYTKLADWINEQYELGIKKHQEVEKLLKQNNEKLENLKIEIATQEIEYLAKEKQISTFLECKKSFFGKFKYYFKYSKKSNKNKEKAKIEIEEKQELEKQEIIKKRKSGKKQNYTIEELVELYKKLETIENKYKNIVMDINALKLKHKNMTKKLENATAFIEEIDSHKKSIFEFWKYSNKDEMASLPEGEMEEVNVIKKITKIFDYEEDIEKFGITMDSIQRKNLTKEETDSIYITTTNILDIINKVKNKEIETKDLQNSLKELKEEAVNEKSLMEEDFDIFGGIAHESTKISKIKNKKHRELPKDKFNILDINKNTKSSSYKITLEKIVQDIQNALNAVIIPEGLPVYKAIIDDKLDEHKINIFNINPENEIAEALYNNGKNKINFYKIDLKEGTNAISFTNAIFYDNQNKTLPVGQDLSTKILVDVAKIKINLKKKSLFKVIQFEDEKDDFSIVKLKTFTVYEYTTINYL